MSMVVPGDEVYTAMCFMIGMVFVFLVVSYYLATIIPSEYGVPKAWHWPITDLIRMIRRVPDPEKQIAKVMDDEVLAEDADVKQERDRVLQSKFDPRSPLVLKGMRKVYATRMGAPPKKAVKDVTFAVENGLVFGLLGPNGAGKTTLISILTGIYNATAGYASIAGYNIDTERDQVYRVLGICPQVLNYDMFTLK